MHNFLGYTVSISFYDMWTPKLPDGRLHPPSLKVLPVHGSVVNPSTDNHFDRL